MTESIKTADELQLQLGDSVRALRIQQALTQRGLASRAGVSSKSVAKLEQAQGSTVETLVRVLRALGATDGIESLAPVPRVSPLALLRSSAPRRRFRSRGHRNPGP